MTPCSRNTFRFFFSLVFVSDPWGAFWAGTPPFTGPRLASCAASGTRTLSKTADANLDCGFVENALFLPDQGFYVSKTGVKKYISHKHCTIKVCVSSSWRCSGTSMPSVPHLTVFLYLCNLENAWGKSRAQCQPERPFKSLRWRRGSRWEEQNR